MANPLEHRKELGLEELEPDEVFEKTLEELDHILEAREQTAALTFNWKEGMETSLNSLYEEWPMLLRWIPFFQALVETVQAYLAFRGAGTINRSKYLKQVSSLADSIFSSEGVKGTDKELLVRQKIGTLGERLKNVVWLNEAQVEDELKRILKEIQSDLSHEESYSTIQLIFQEAKKINPENRWSWINEQIQKRVASNTQWRCCLNQLLSIQAKKDGCSPRLSKGPRVYKFFVTVQKI